MVNALLRAAGRLPRAPLAATPADDRPTRAAVALFGLGGVPALVDQVAWQRLLALHSGVGAVSVTVIVAAYMAGLGVGSLAGGLLSRRLSPRGALVAFAAVELTLGAFAWSSGAFYHDLPGFPRSWFRAGPWALAASHFLALVPPTALMGMTFPLLTRALVRDAGGAAGLVGRLYAANLAGAAAGALLTPWVLIPYLGLTGALRVAASCNALGALGVLAAGLRLPPVVASRAAATDARPTGGRVPLPAWAVLTFLGGFAAIALEVVWFRVIDVGAKATAFTFGTVLSVYLAGLSAGTYAETRRNAAGRDPLLTFLACQCGVLAYAAVGLVVVAYLPPWVWGFAGLFDYWGSYEPVTPGWRAAGATLGLYAAFPLVLFGPPTVLMGAAFAALQRGVQDDAGSSGFKVGLLQAVNIAGCVAGGLLVGLRGLEAVGTPGTVAALAAAGAPLAAAGAARAWGVGRPAGRWVLAALGLLAVAAAVPGRDAFWRRLHGRRDAAGLVSEDVAGVAALTPEGDGRWRVSANGKGQSFLPFGGVHTKLGALPATLHPAPAKVAVVGLGSGDTAWAAACRPETTALTVFEVCPGQLPLLRDLNRRAHLPELRSFLRDGRVRVVEADGRDALLAHDDRYDLIEADAVRPDGAYAGNLYSVEFFRACAARLRPGGFLCTWSPTPRTKAGFRRVFPHIVEVDGGVVLIGSNDPIRLDPDAWRARLLDPAVAAHLGPGPLAECLAAVATARPLRAVDPGDLSEEFNTDLFPRDEYPRPFR